MSLCLLAAAALVRLDAAAFTLAWTHSVERTRWEEDWRLAPEGLVVTQARVRGSGAGVDPPLHATLEDGWWIWTPDLPPQRELILAASGATGQGWTLCAAGRCRELGAEPAAPVRIAPCQPLPPAPRLP